MQRRPFQGHLQPLSQEILESAARGWCSSKEQSPSNWQEFVKLKGSLRMQGIGAGLGPYNELVA